MINNKILCILKENNIKYELIEHKAIYSVADGTQLNIPPDTISKNLFLCDRKKENYYLFTLYKDAQITLKELQGKINSKRLSFATDEDLQNILGLQRGCVSPLGIFNDKAGKTLVFIDEYFKNKTIAIPLNQNTITILLNADDLIFMLKMLNIQISWLSE